MGRIILCMLLLGLLPSLLIAQPWQPTILWEHAGPGLTDQYGYSVFALGDQNNDGYADWGTEAYNDDSAVVEFFHGGNPPDNEPYRVFTTDSGLLAFYGGYAFNDINGDGYIDIALIKRYPSSPAFQTYEFYFGGPSQNTVPDVVFAMPCAAPTYIYLLSFGDFNGDGFDDLFRLDLYGEIGQVYFGGNPPDTLIDWTLYREASMQAQLQGYGDLNGDGFDDFVTETPGGINTRLWIYHGGTVPDTNATYVIHGGNFGDYLDAEAIVNDLNGDGRAELITGATDGLAIGWGAERIHDDPDWFVADPCATGNWQEVRGIGDFNHDGYGDFIKTAESCFGEGNGEAQLFLGHFYMPTAAAVILDGDGPPLNMTGFNRAAGLGDVNGDGIDDLALCSRKADNYRGKVVILAGDPLLRLDSEEPPALLPEKLAVSVYPNPFNSMTEIRYAVPRTSHVSLKVFDVMGREVGCLVNRVVNAGEGRLAWDANGVASGVYFVRLDAGDVGMTRKVLLVR